MAAGNASEKETVRFAVSRIVTADYVALRVDAVAFAGICSGHRNFHGDEGAIALNEAVLIAALVEVETDKVSLRVDAGNPGERGIGNVDRGELAVRERKTVELVTAVDVSAHNSCGIEGHGRESSRCTGDVDEGEVVVAKNIAAALKEVVAEKHADDVAAIAEAKAGNEGQSGNGRIDGFEGAVAQNVSVAATRVVETADQVAASISPGNVGESCAPAVDGGERPVAQGKAVLYAVGAVVAAGGEPSR
jgi:hypothetical protein